MGNSTILRVRKLFKDKKAVFGLTSVQQFFAIILGLALLAYVIVVIMGTLNGSTILPTSSLSATVINESSFINGTTDQLDSLQNILGLSNIAVILAINGSNGQTIVAANYTVSSTGVISNATAIQWNRVNITYSYNYNTQTTNNANDILSNTSVGISGFFGSITPVYAILAILVIILVLIVLVRVVTGGSIGQRNVAPQL